MTRLLPLLCFLLPILTLISGLALAPFLAIFLLAAIPAAFPGNARQIASILSQLRPRGLALQIILLAMGWALLSSAWSLSPRISLDTGARSLLLMLCGSALCTCVRRFPAELAGRCGRGLAYGVLCTVLVLILEAWQAGPISGFMQAAGLDALRFFAKNINRGLCLLVLLLWPAQLALHRGGRRVAAMLLPLAALVPVCLWHSLSAKLGLALGIGTYAALMLCPAARRPAGVAIFSLAALWPAGIYYVAPKLLFSLNTLASLPLSTLHRLVIWEFSMARAAEKPWTGWGLNSSRLIPGGEIEFAPRMVNMPLHPHNLSIQLLLEQGIIGFALFLAALGLLLKAWADKPGPDRAWQASTAACMTAYLSIGLTAFGMWQGWWLAAPWLMAALCLMGRRSSVCYTAPQPAFEDKTAHAALPV